MSDVHRGEILVFVPPGWRAVVAHRVVSVRGPADHPVVITKGDANPVQDPWHAQLDGPRATVVVGSIPWLGWIMTATGHIWLRLVLIGLLGLGACLVGTSAILGHAGTRLGPSLRPQHRRRRRPHPTPTAV